MKRRAFLLSVTGLVLVACAPAAPTTQTGGPSVSSAPTTGYARPELLLETDKLADTLKSPNLRILDLRTKEKYNAGHIPGAVYFDGAGLKDPQDKLFAPKPEVFVKLMGEAGVGPETSVVAYDDGGGLSSARLWWVLDYYSFSKVQILNGGFPKWTKEGRATDTIVPTVAPVTFPAKLNPDSVCALDLLETAIKSDDYIIIDARTAAEYAGTDVRANRGGHVPKAINIDWQRNVTNDDVRTWRTATELRELYENAGVRKDKEIITYCQTAVRAAHTFFTLRLLGYGKVRNYDGSWAEYGNRADTQVVR